MAFWPNFGVNLRPCLCGVASYASAQALDFLELGQKFAFLDWKHHPVPIIVKNPLMAGHYLFDIHCRLNVISGSVKPGIDL